MQKILMNYYEYDKERHIIMVDVYLLPANEGDCLWVRYGKKEGTRHNIIIDGGVESNGGDIASIIENIAERNEKVDIFVTHIDGDHIRGLIKGIGISNAEVLKKCVDTIYFNNKKDILDKFR
ncbi:MBL fold metallo-hydrolase, partial [Blautia wexlerae]